jgi:hypothetical protein
MIGFTPCVVWESAAEVASAGYRIGRFRGHTDLFCGTTHPSDTV